MAYAYGWYFTAHCGAIVVGIAECVLLAALLWRPTDGARAAPPP
jgi:hypothetical protein